MLLNIQTEKSTFICYAIIYDYSMIFIYNLQLWCEWKNGVFSVLAARQNGHSAVVQNLIDNKASIDQVMINSSVHCHQWELIDDDKYRASLTLKELTKHERCCCVASNGYW